MALRSPSGTAHSDADWRAWYARHGAALQRIVAGGSAGREAYRPFAGKQLVEVQGEGGKAVVVMGAFEPEGEGE